MYSDAAKAAPPVVILMSASPWVPGCRRTPQPADAKPSVPIGMDNFEWASVREDGGGSTTPRRGVRYARVVRARQNPVALQSCRNMTSDFVGYRLAYPFGAMNSWNGG